MSGTQNKRKRRKNSRKSLPPLVVVLILLALMLLAERLLDEPGEPVSDPAPAVSQAVSSEAGLTVYYVDVGQGDCELLESDGEYLLIDAGGDGDHNGAVVDFLDQLGWSFIKLEEEGMASPVMSVEGVYKKSTTFPDTISIMVGIEKLSAAKLTFSYEFKCKDELVFQGKSTHCFLDTNGRPVLIERQYPKFYAELKEIAEAGKKE